MTRPLTRAEMLRDYDMVRGCLRPAYDRLADAQYIKRCPITDEVSWPRSTIEDDLRRLGLA